MLAANQEGIGVLEVLDGVTMQVLWHAVASCEGGFVRDAFTMIAASVQGDVDGITKRSHYARLQPTASASQSPRLGHSRADYLQPCRIPPMRRPPTAPTTRIGP